MRLLILLFALSFNISVYSYFDDSFYNAKSLAFSNSSLLNNQRLNPASFGESRFFITQLSYLNLNHTPYNSENSNTISFESFIPSRIETKNVTYYISYQKDYLNTVNLNSLIFGIGSYHLLDYNEDYLDIGLNIKKLTIEQDKLNTTSSMLMDLGFMVRRKDYLFGLSFLNINGNLKDELTKTSSQGVIKFTMTRYFDDFNVNFDITRRSSIFQTNSYNFTLSAEQLYRTYRYGAFSTIVSLSVGDNRSFTGLGISYRKDIWELTYSLGFALNSPNTLNNSILLSVFFGKRDVESDYEKIIKREIKYRKDLMEELYQSKQREEKLRGNIAKLQSEIDELTYKLDKLSEKIKTEKLKKQEIEMEKEKLKNILDSIKNRQKKHQEELKAIEEKRKQEKLKLLEFEFNKDYENYLKLKAQGVSKETLISYLKKIITQYQGTGIDISKASIEIQNLLK